MFRNGLLISTAMTAVALLLSGTPTGAFAQTNMHVAKHDPNTRFLCTYGQFTVSAFFDFSGPSSSYISGWEHVAVPITGHGQTVSRIRVMEAQASYTSHSAFSAGIYSNSPSGFPGQPIAIGTGRASPTCGPVKIAITPTTLKRHTTYWIEETTFTGYCRKGSCSVGLYWEANPTTKRKAYVQKHWFNYSNAPSGSSSYTSPWTKQTKGPYFKLR